MKSRIQTQLELEYQVSTGHPPQIPENDFAFRSYEARIILADGKLAEALCDLDRSDLLQRMKSYILRGDLAEAKGLAVALLSSDTQVLNEAPELRCEIHLELARIALYEGNWDLCIAETHLASEMHPPAVTQVTLWQLEAAALGERGDPTAALRMIEKVEAISQVFPGGNVLFYARNQRAKLLIREGRINEGRRMLADLWREYLPMTTGRLSLDFLETLSRTELELCTQTQFDGAAWATLSRRCSREIGDQLFEDVALADFVLNQKTLRRPVSEILLANLLRSRFSRVQNIIAKKNLEQTESAPNRYCLQEELDFRFCYLASRETLIDLQNRSAVPLAKDSVIARALIALSQHSFSIPLDQFFQTLYGLTYYKERHSGIIRTLMTRLRQQTHIEVVSKDGIVSSERPFLVVDFTQ